MVSCQFYFFYRNVVASMGNLSTNERPSILVTDISQLIYTLGDVLKILAGEKSLEFQLAED